MPQVRNCNRVLYLDSFLCVPVLKEISETFSVNENVQQDTKPVSALMGVVKDGVTVKTRPGVGKGRGRPVNSQNTEV